MNDSVAELTQAAVSCTGLTGHRYGQHLAKEKKEKGGDQSDNLGTPVDHRLGELCSNV